VEDEHFSSTSRQSLHRTFDRDPEIRSFGDARGGQHQPFITHLTLPGQPGGLAAPQKEIHRDPMKPGTERRLTREGVQLLPDPDEHFLHRILRIAGIEQPPSEAVDPCHMAAIQPLERGMIAGSGQCHVLPIEIGGSHSELSLQMTPSNGSAANPSLAMLDTCGCSGVGTSDLRTTRVGLDRFISI
jgi:hypothetical protein